MSYQPITDPNKLADLIEGAHQLMLRLGHENGFHKLPAAETALIVKALRGDVARGYITVPEIVANHLYAVSLEVGGKCHICSEFRAAVDDEWPRATPPSNSPRGDK